MERGEELCVRGAEGVTAAGCPAAVGRQEAAHCGEPAAAAAQPGAADAQAEHGALAVLALPENPEHCVSGEAAKISVMQS